MNAESIFDGSCTIDITSNIIRIDLIRLQPGDLHRSERIVVEVNQQLIVPLESALQVKMLGFSADCNKSQQKPTNAVH